MLPFLTLLNVIYWLHAIIVSKTNFQILYEIRGDIEYEDTNEQSGQQPGGNDRNPLKRN